MFELSAAADAGGENGKSWPDLVGELIDEPEKLAAFVDMFGTEIAWVTVGSIACYIAFLAAKYGGSWLVGFASVKLAWGEAESRHDERKKELGHKVVKKLGHNPSPKAFIEKVKEVEKQMEQMSAAKDEESDNG